MRVHFEAWPGPEEEAWPGARRDGRSLCLRHRREGRAPFETHNKTAKASDQLKPGDFILKVNGVEGEAQKIQVELKTAKSVEVVVRRAVEICLAIDKKDAKQLMGVEFPKQIPGAGLLITKITEGPLQDWNVARGHRERCERCVRCVRRSWVPAC